MAINSDIEKQFQKKIDEEQRRLMHESIMKSSMAQSIAPWSTHIADQDKFITGTISANPGMFQTNTIKKDHTFMAPTITIKVYKANNGYVIEHGDFNSSAPQFTVVGPDEKLHEIVAAVIASDKMK